MFRWICDLSRLAHDALFDGKSQSICSRAWECRRRSYWAALVVLIFGAKHCYSSWRHYHGDTPHTPKR